ncbi:MAG: TrmB family transcriptional regulator [Candidatus Diapherotrites archaeon]|nr:TrmB family transcriptional regulator [Candidatus Diapherotrites archaeon]
MSEMVALAKKLGLNEYESKGFIALLSVGHASASEVSRHSLIPRARVYDVLSSLEKKGFIEKKLSRPVSYSAFLPSAVAKNIGEQKKNLLEKEIQEIASISKLIEQTFSKNSRHPVLVEEVKLLKGQENIYSKISKELENCSESVLFCTTPLGVERKKAEFKKNFETLSKKGVKIVFKQSDLRYCVVDKKTLFLFLNPDKEKKDEESALLIKNPFLAIQFAKK